MVSFCFSPMAADLLPCSNHGHVLDGQLQLLVHMLTQFQPFWFYLQACCAPRSICVAMSERRVTAIRAVAAQRDWDPTPEPYDPHRESLFQVCDGFLVSVVSMLFC
jgi:hypothetical protein